MPKGATTKGRERGSRLPNPTAAQREALLEYMERHPHFATGRLHAPNASKLVKRMTDRMAAYVNGIEDGVPRDGLKWWKCWKDMKNAAKDYASKNHWPKSHKTGGGAPCDETIMSSMECDSSVAENTEWTSGNDNTDRILSIIGWHSALGLGVPDELESDDDTTNEAGNKENHGKGTLAPAGGELRRRASVLEEAVGSGSQDNLMEPMRSPRKAVKSWPNLSSQSPSRFATSTPNPTVSSCTNNQDLFPNAEWHKDPLLEVPAVRTIRLGAPSLTGTKTSNRQRVSSETCVPSHVQNHASNMGIPSSETVPFDCRHRSVSESVLVNSSYGAHMTEGGSLPSLVSQQPNGTLVGRPMGGSSSFSSGLSENGLTSCSIPADVIKELVTTNRQVAESLDRNSRAVNALLEFLMSKPRTISSGVNTDDSVESLSDHNSSHQSGSSSSHQPKSNSTQHHPRNSPQCLSLTTIDNMFKEDDSEPPQPSDALQLLIDELQISMSTSFQ